MVKWGSIARHTRPVVAVVGLLAAGLLAATALGAEPTPDPAPVTTTASKPKPTASTKTRPKPTVTRTTNRARSTTTSTRTTSVTTTPTRTRTAPTKTRTSRRKPVTHRVAKKPVARKVRPRAQPHVVKKRHATPQPVVRPAPATPAPAEPVSNGDGPLIRSLLLALTILSLVLALVPWRHLFYPRIRPSQALRVRVAFATISLSVGFGYVITAYLNGST